MTHLEIIVATLKRDIDFIKATLGDFSEEQMLMRPVAGANHPTWQIGHLVAAESRLVNAAQAGAVPPPPATYLEKFNKETAKEDAAGFFPRKAELLEALAKGREATIAWAQGLKQSDLDKVIPPPTNRFAGTIGELLHMLPLHGCMHVGQFQVARSQAWETGFDVVILEDDFRGMPRTTTGDLLPPLPPGEGWGEGVGQVTYLFRISRC